jgi:hypothetical protein
MKKLIFAIALMLPILGQAQAHLGESLESLKKRYPDKYFKIEFTDDGTKYTTAEQPLGTFVYYFDEESGLTSFCIQIPDNMQALSAQVEIYNGKYVIISDTKWKAYLDGGGILNINLTYNENLESFIFVYTN